MKCNQCYWNFDNQCVSEKEETYGHETQYTDDCIGYLDSEFEQLLWNIHDECVRLVGKRNLNELLAIKNFIIGQRDEVE